MRDLYHLITMSDVQKDEAAILAVLKEIHEGRAVNDLRILNYYKEMPLIYGAAIKSVENGMLEVGIHQHQAVVMYVDKTVFLKSSQFPHDVVAKVYRSNITKSSALLHNFAFAQVRAERRRYVRVQVNETVRANFRRNETFCEGRLLDISIGGLSMESREYFPCDSETAMVITLDLPSGMLEVPGRLLKISRQDDMTYYIFELEASSRIEAAISQFIFHEQVEIIRELKDQLAF